MSARLVVEDGVAVVTLDNAPVNALKPAVLDSLFEQLRKAQRNPEVKAIVLTGAHGKFCAGFDFTLFGTPQMSAILDSREEALKEIGALLENGPKPTVAAVEGACLGGGCELAMACNARVTAQGAQLGLPEVRLGLLPGLGGTQRMPRLVGMEQALNLMLSASPVSADDALAIGLVDEVVPSADLLAAARAAALVLAAGSRPRRRTLQLTQHMPASGEGFVAAGRALQDAEAQVSRKFAGQPHLEYLLEAAAAGLVQGAGAGLQKEGEGFRAAASSRMHRLTLHFFKATRALKRAPAPLRLLIQIYLFLGFVFMYFYVRVAYIQTSFVRGYNMARKKGDKKGAGGSSASGGASGSGASSSKAAAAGTRKKK